MSVYIKNMEMPDKCGHCRFANAFDCTVTGSFISTHSIRQPDCPLVPVSEHGPLVDVLDIINAFPVDFIFTNEQARALTNYIIPADKEGDNG